MIDSVTVLQNRATSGDRAQLGQANPLVSVVIPSYNHARYLEGAIRSALQQTYDNCEIIVVDDGSTDDTKEVVAKYADRVRYIWQENQGLSAARNAGIRAAEGQLIGLLDADDLYEPQFIATLTSVLMSDPEMDAVYCKCITVDAENNPLPQRIGQIVPPDQLHRTLLNGGFFPPLCMFARKYCYEELGLFNRSFQGCADWDMWLRMSARYNIAGVDEVLARYRVVQDSMSHDHRHMLDDRTRVLHEYFPDEPADRSRWTASYRRASAYNQLRATIEFLQVHDQEQANHYLREAFTTYPELAADLDVFYRLGLGSQPMGYRGDFSTLDLDRNARVLLSMMDRLFDNPPVPPQLKSYRRVAYANSYLALGLLNYGARRFGEARGFLIRAMMTKPGYVFRRRYLSTLAKSLLGVQTVDRFKGMNRQKRVS